MAADQVPYPCWALSLGAPKLTPTRVTPEVWTLYPRSPATLQPGRSLWPEKMHLGLCFQKYRHHTIRGRRVTPKGYVEVLSLSTSECHLYRDHQVKRGSLGFGWVPTEYD